MVLEWTKRLRTEERLAPRLHRNRVGETPGYCRTTTSFGTQRLLIRAVHGARLRDRDPPRSAGGPRMRYGGDPMAQPLTMRINPGEFRARPLRVHALLYDVPLEDAWAIPLSGGGAG